MGFIVQSGVVKVYNINSAGDEQIVAFHTAGDIFPTSWIFNLSNTTMYYYETLSDCEVLIVPRTVLYENIIKSPELLRESLDYFVKSYNGLLMRVTALEQSRASEKLLFTLYYLLFRYGTEKEPGWYTIDLSLTQNTIASLIGLTRETAAAELNKLRKQGIIRYTQQAYSVNRQGIERTLGEDSFKDVLVG
jgi:CRP/FNR family transcriptional regulator